MQNLVLIQLSVPELEQLLQDVLDKYFIEKQTNVVQTITNEFGGIELAVQITGLAKATIYTLVSARKIPHSKQGKKLYFSRNELTEWLKQGKRKTKAEIALDAKNFRQTIPKTKQP